MKIGYDEAGRLETVWENGFVTGTYGYDENGNRLSHGGMEATYDDQDRMMTYGDNAYTYTVNGDILTKIDTQGTPDTADDELTAYTHDALGNLTGVTLTDSTAITYTYDGRNRLIAKKVNGTVDYRLIYAGQLAPVAKVDASGTTIETYIYGLGVNAPDYILKDGVKYRLVKDHLGTPRLVVNATTGEVVKRLDLDEFGNITAETGTFDIPFGFAGGIRDADTGLTKFGARWYDPETGRWLEKEPLGFRGSNNFYSYCDGDPVNWVDWNGLFRFDPSVPADVQKAIKSIQWDKKKIDAYRKLTGITASQFYEAIKDDSGPLISVENLRDPKAVAQCPQDPGNLILLDSDHLDEYFGDPSLSQLFIDDIVGHELAHYFNWMTGIGDNSYKFNDIGHQWEREALGSTGNWPLDKPFYITP